MWGKINGKVHLRVEFQVWRSHNSVYAFTHYLVHSLFGWELTQLVFIALEPMGLEPKNCPNIFFFKSDSSVDQN